MKRRLSLAALLAFLFALIAAPAAFAADFRVDTDITIAKGEVIDDDLYLFGTTIVIDGTVNGNVIVAGTTVKINGTVNGAADIAATDLVVNGVVSQSVRAAANSVTIVGSIGEDLLLAANTAEIGADAGIGRDLIAYANTLTLDGAVERRLSGGMGTLNLNGAVGTDVDIDVDSLVIADGARIGRDLTYRSNEAAEIASGAQIGGEITAEESAVTDVEEGFSFDSYVPAVIGLLMAVVYGTVLLFGFPRLTVAASNQLIGSPLLSLGLGVVFLIVVPILSVIVMITVVGIPLGIVALLLYGIALFSGQVFVGMSIGRLIFSFFTDANRRLIQFVGLLLGLIILFALGFIPYVGAWIPLLVAIFGLGGLMVALGRLRQEPARAGSAPAEG